MNEKEHPIGCSLCFGLSDMLTIYFVCGDEGCPVFGMRILVPQLLQRTVFPRAIAGIDRTFLHVRFGHMILTIF